MNKLFAFRSSIVSCAAELILGILMLVNPEGLARAVCTLLGVFMLVRGIYRCAQYFRTPASEAKLQGALTEALLLTAVGLLLIFNNGIIIGALGAITFIYGFMMLILGLGKVQWAVDLARVHDRAWYVAAIDAALILILSIIAMVNPFAADTALITFIGISLIVGAVADICSVIVIKRFFEAKAE